jgi:hypothetical protein
MPPRIWRVLIMPGDTEIGLEPRRSLAWSKEVDLYSASSSSAAHGSFVFARHFFVPSVLEEVWLPVPERVIDGLLVRHERLLSTYYAFSYIACFCITLRHCL